MVERSGNYGGFGGFGGGGPNWNALFSMGDITEKTRAHLSRVYFTLLISAVSCVLGMFMNSQFMMEGFVLTIVSICAIGYFIF